jgi:mono/diheme cytochrome c family protein
MKRNILVATLAAGTLMLAGPALAGDVAKGKATHDEACAECHEAVDFEGMSAGEIEQAIKDIIAGKVKHKSKIGPEIQAVAADLAAYYASGG